MENKDKYPRVTQAQVELWLADPVTQAYKTCLRTNSETVKAKLGAGEYIDSFNNDLSMNKIHSASGWSEALDAMGNFESILSKAEMIEVPKNEG